MNKKIGLYCGKFYRDLIMGENYESIPQALGNIEDHVVVLNVDLEEIKANEDGLIEDCLTLNNDDSSL